MARFIDLDEVEGDVSASVAGDAVQSNNRSSKNKDVEPRAEGTPTVTNAMTEAFSCYPIVVAVASSIDLNTLDALARASRAIHNGLIQYRVVLLTSTLRCSNEPLPFNHDELLRYRARASNWHYMDDSRSYNGKSGKCARDMVGECKRCGEVICRNCAIKPPVPIALRERHRRLCVTCARAPIATLTQPPLDEDKPLSSEAVQRAICKCDSQGVWLCQPCGRSIRAADHEYQRIWRWRNQYGEVLGGLGTGIGDGDRGVICGREGDCLAAREREHEVDCDAQDARDTGTAPWTVELPSPSSESGSTSSHAHATSAAPHGPNHVGGSPSPIATPLIDEFRHENERTPSPQLGPGYERHEIEGIGGKVKRKLVRMVRVGACVPEWDDEKGVGSRVLGPEVRGAARSWCGWCWRVIPSNKDVDESPGSAQGKSRTGL